MLALRSGHVYKMMTSSGASRLVRIRLSVDYLYSCGVYLRKLEFTSASSDNPKSQAINLEKICSSVELDLKSDGIGQKNEMVDELDNNEKLLIALIGKLELKLGMEIDSSLRSVTQELVKMRDGDLVKIETINSPEIRKPFERHPIRFNGKESKQQIMRKNRYREQSDSDSISQKSNKAGPVRKQNTKETKKLNINQKYVMKAIGVTAAIDLRNIDQRRGLDHVQTRGRHRGQERAQQQADPCRQQRMDGLWHHRSGLLPQLPRSIHEGIYW